jgi:hypothetical protein
VSTDKKIYQLYGVDTAVKLLRPGARWEIFNGEFSIWEDPRPAPTMEEVIDCMEKLKAFEDSIDVIFTEEQILQIKNKQGLSHGII